MADDRGVERCPCCSNPEESCICVIDLDLSDVMIPTPQAASIASPELAEANGDAKKRPSAVVTPVDDE